MPRQLLLAAIASLAALAVPATATALVTSSTVTAPASPFTASFDLGVPSTDPARTFTMSGLATAADGDLVDLRCAYRRADGLIGYALLGGGADVPVTGGAFSREVSSPGQYACALVATPDNVNPLDLAPFTGPRHFGAVTQTVTVGGLGPNAAAVRDYYGGSASPVMDADFSSIGRGGAPWDMTPIDSAGAVPAYAEELWYGNAALHGVSSQAGESRSQLQVDGVNAFAPATAAALYPEATTAAGLPSAVVESRTFDPVTHDVTHVVTEPIVTCPANVTAGGATASTCAPFQPSGVAVRRTIAIRNATHAVETKDRWVSTDGRPHAIDLLYNEDQHAAGPEVNGYRFPWVDGTTFKTHTAGDEIAPPPGRVASLFAKVKADAPDDDPRWSQGSLTLSTSPDLIRFTTDHTLEIGFRRTVPATGALGIDQRFTIGTTRADVEAQATTMEQRATAGLAVTITSPTQVTGYDPAHTVSGTTTTPGGVRSLVVNDAAVTPAADGSWSAKVRLVPGANPLTVTVTDASGDSAATTGTVTFTPGPAQSTLLDGGVRRGVLNASVRCQTVAGTTCAGRLQLTARVTRVKRTRRGRRKSTKTVTLAARTYAVPEGDSAVPPVRLGRATRALVRKYRIRRATLTLTQTVRGITKTTKTSVPVRL